MNSQHSMLPRKDRQQKSPIQKSTTPDPNDSYAQYATITVLHHLLFRFPRHAAHDLRRRYAQERHVQLSRDGVRQEGLSTPWWPVQENASWLQRAHWRPEKGRKGAGDTVVYSGLVQKFVVDGVCDKSDGRAGSC